MAAVGRDAALLQGAVAAQKEGTLRAMDKTDRETRRRFDTIGQVCLLHIIQSICIQSIYIQSIYIQSMFSLCSVYISTMKVCLLHYSVYMYSVYIQSTFSLCSVYISTMKVCLLKFYIIQSIYI